MTRIFFYDGQQILEEYSGNPLAICAQYLYGIGIDEPLLRKQGETQLYYHTNSLGSVVALTNSSGVLVESIEYDVYGEPSITQHGSNPPTGNRFLFTGREWDAQTGLYHYRARAYSPSLGRFLQRDPMEFDALLNLYTYVVNNPSRFTDPFGLRENYMARITYLKSLEKDFNSLYYPIASLGALWLHFFGIDVVTLEKADPIPDVQREIPDLRVKRIAFRHIRNFEEKDCLASYVPLMGTHDRLVLGWEDDTARGALGSHWTNKHLILYQWKHLSKRDFDDVLSNFMHEILHHFLGDWHSREGVMKSPLGQADRFVDNDSDGTPDILELDCDTVRKLIEKTSVQEEDIEKEFIIERK